jgi:hypothetical protein
MHYLHPNGTSQIFRDPLKYLQNRCEDVETLSILMLQLTSFFDRKEGF